jgi:hypothetical protein
MNAPVRTPLFCVILKDGQFWQVEAEWPDGTIEQVCEFKNGTDALNWVKTETGSWLASRVTMNGA